MRPPAPSRRRRLLLGVASGAVVLALGGCGGTGPGDGAGTTSETGSETGSAGASASPTPGQGPSSEATGTPGTDTPTTGTPTTGEAAGRPRLVELVSMTAAGGTVTAVPTPVAGEAQRASYLVAFDGRARARLRTAFAQVDDPRAGELTATVVAVGCVPPEDVRIVETGTDGTDPATVGYEVVPVATRSPDVQCFAPVTTVALVLLPS